MAALQSSLSTETSLLFSKPNGSRCDIPKHSLRSSKVTMPLKLKSLEASRKISHVSEIDRLFSLLRNDSVSDCRQIHCLAVKLMAFGDHGVVGNKLVALYSRNEGLLSNARKLFDEIPERTRTGYAALITAFCRSGQWEELVFLLRLMVSEDLWPDKYAVPSVLKAFSALEMLRSGKMMHGLVVRQGLDSDIFVGNTLIDFYSNCGDLRSSKLVFELMREKDVVSWTALVSGFMNVGFLDEAMGVFHSMQSNGIKPDLISWNTLVSGFARNGEVGLALRYLEEMQEKDVKPRVNSWNGIISGCAQNNYFEDALDAFCSMLRFPEDPNFVTMASILPACAGLRDINLGKAIHGICIRHQLCRNVHVEGSLIDMYAKCSRRDYAGRVFVMAENKNTATWNEMIASSVNEGNMTEALELLRSMQSDGPKPDVISFNTLFAGYARNGQKDEAFKLFSEMKQMYLSPNIVSFNVLISGFQQSGLCCEALELFQAMMFTNVLQPNPVTTTSALAACAELRSKCRGKEIHAYILRNGFERNVYVSSALVHMYLKCSDTISASKVFRRIEERNTICWNTLIAGHVNAKNPEIALGLFTEMLSEGVEPSPITLMTLLLACGDLGAVRSGRELHGCILRRRVGKCDANLANALIGMYAKCGSMIEAKSVFDSEVKEDVYVWNSKISSCSIYGISKSDVALFEQLELAGIWPLKF